MQEGTLDVSRFVGGQIEIQNPDEGSLFRGEIAYIEGDGEELRADLNWLAQGEGYPPLPKRWVRDHRTQYCAAYYSVQDIGPGSDGGGSRFSLQTFSGELVVLFPPDGSRLDPAVIEER